MQIGLYSFVKCIELLNSNRLVFKHRIIQNAGVLQFMYSGVTTSVKIVV